MRLYSSISKMSVKYVCILYVSTSCPLEIQQIMNNTLKSTMKSKLIHSFEDSVYNRTSFYLVGTDIIDDAVNLYSNALK